MNAKTGFDTNSLTVAIERCTAFRRIGPPKLNLLEELICVQLGLLPAHVDSGYPIEASLALTSECPLSCSHCYSRLRPTAATSPQHGVILDAVGQLHSAGVRRITLTGGEPLRGYGVDDVLDRIKALKMGVIVQTSGTGLTPARLDHLAERLAPDSDAVQISLDGCTQATHDSIRGPGSFELACHAIKCLVESSIAVIVSSCPMQSNQHEIVGIYELATALGATAFQATPLAPFHQSLDCRLPDQDVCFIAEAEILDKSLLMPLYLGGVTGEDAAWISHPISRTFLVSTYPRLSRFRCAGGVSKVHIEQDGGVYPCVFAVAPTLRLGTLQDDSFADIMESRKTHSFFDGRQASEIVCVHCPWNALCRGGCPGLALARFGSLKYPDPRCTYAQQLARLLEWGDFGHCTEEL